MEIAWWGVASSSRHSGLEHETVKWWARRAQESTGRTTGTSRRHLEDSTGNDPRSREKKKRNKEKKNS